MSSSLARALASLVELPERAPMTDEATRLRELRVPFGRYGYVVQYRVDTAAVVVARIFHTREAR